jgi:hypothetical protein
MFTRQGSLLAQLVGACALTLALAATAPSGVRASQGEPAFGDPSAEGIALPTWRSRYVWSENDGYSGWSTDVFGSDSAAYEFAPGLQGVGSLWAWPTGDREYRPGGGEWFLRAPGTTRIARATVDLAYRTKVFAHLCLDAGLRSRDEGRDTHRDCKPPAQPATEDGYVQAFSDPDAAPKATEAYMQLVMPSCNNPADTPCSKYIPSKDPVGNGPMVRAKAVSLVLVDDDLPIVTGSDAFYELDGRYINGREVYPLMISASDAGAGIGRIAFDHVGHSTLADRAAPCDPNHRTPELGARICPPPHEETLVDSQTATSAFSRIVTSDAGT